MYNIIGQIIGYTGAAAIYDEFVFAVCGVLIAVIFVCIVDLVYRIFSHFWHG